MTALRHVPPSARGRAAGPGPRGRSEGGAAGARAGRILRFLVLCGVCMGAGPVSASMLVKRLELAEVTAAADRIVHGHVVQVRSGRDGADVPSTWITVDIAETLKGKRLRRFTFKQFGVAEPLADGTVTGLGGLPHYRPGEEVVLFLYGRSTRGFRSPVGLTQGVFRVKGSGAAAEVRADSAMTTPRRFTDFLATVRRQIGAGR